MHTGRQLSGCRTWQEGWLVYSDLQLLMQPLRLLLLLVQLLTLEARASRRRSAVLVVTGRGCCGVGIRLIIWLRGDNRLLCIYDNIVVVANTPDSEVSLNWAPAAIGVLHVWLV